MAGMGRVVNDQAIGKMESHVPTMGAGGFKIEKGGDSRNSRWWESPKSETRLRTYGRYSRETKI